MEPLSEKRRQEDNRRQHEQWLESFKGFEAPNQAVLEGSVESNSKCGKCDGKVRAVCLQAQKADGVVHDLDILVSLHCRDAKCEWKSTQWRPWSRHEPKEL